MCTLNYIACEVDVATLWGGDSSSVHSAHWCKANLDDWSESCGIFPFSLAVWLKIEVVVRFSLIESVLCIQQEFLFSLFLSSSLLPQGAD